MNPKSISMIHKQLTTYFKVKYGSILIGYYKSHACGDTPHAHTPWGRYYGNLGVSVLGKSYGLL